MPEPVLNIEQIIIYATSENYEYSPKECNPKEREELNIKITDFSGYMVDPVLTHRDSIELTVNLKIAPPG